jgi:WD40 repeat protein
MKIDLNSDLGESFGPWPIATANAQSQVSPTVTITPQPSEQDQETLAYQLALEAELLLNEQPQLLERSILLAIESVQRHPHTGAVNILKNGISLLPRYEMALNHRDFGYLLAYSPDGQLVASTGDDNNHVLIWDINNSSEVDRLVFNDSVRSIKFSPQGDYLAIVWGDLFGGENTVALWEKAEGEETMSFNFDDNVLTAQFSPDTHYLATVTEEVVTLWDLTTKQEIMKIPNDGTDVSFSTDGQFMNIIFDNSVQRWNIAIEIPVDTIVVEDTIQWKTLFSPQGNYLLYDSFGVARFLELGTGVVIELEFPPPYLNTEFAFSPDEKYLVAAQSEGSLAGDTFGQDLLQVRAAKRARGGEK